MEYKNHPAAELFPMMGVQELADLTADIKKNGLVHPIVLFREQILDGRNRYLACQSAKVQPRFEIWSGDGSPTEWVLSVNLHRRHLTPSQKGCIAHDALPMFEAEAKERQRATLKRGEKIPDREIIPEREKGKATEKAAAAVGVNPRYVSDAKKIKAEAPEQYEEIKAGKKTIPAVMKEMKGRTETPLPKVEFSKEAEEADKDSDVLFQLKRWWNKATKKDKKNFRDWAESNPEKAN